MIRETFLPHLFFGEKKNLSTIIGALRTMPVKKIKVETPESSDVRKRKVPNFSSSKNGTN